MVFVNTAHIFAAASIHQALSKVSTILKTHKVAALTISQFLNDCQRNNTKKTVYNDTLIEITKDLMHKNTYDSELLPSLEKLLTTINYKLDLNSSADLIQTIAHNYHPDFRPLIDFLMPKIEPTSCATILGAMAIKSHYHIDFEFYIPTLLHHFTEHSNPNAFAPDNMFISKPAEVFTQISSKTNYHQPILPLLKKLAPKFKARNNLNYMVTLLTHQDHYHEAVKPFIEYFLIQMTKSPYHLYEVTGQQDYLYKTLLWLYKNETIQPQASHSLNILATLYKKLPNDW
jgi:hypothetical protein